MNLDIRRPIGLLFTLLGVLLIGASVFGDPGLQHISAYLNAGWGGVLTIFGVSMLLLARRKAAP
jgi:predicted phage tail protein